MAQTTRTILKGYFETGDVPTQAQFIDLIDSQTNITDDGTPLTETAADLLYEPIKGADDNFVTDAEKVVIGNTSGTNTGDQDISGIATNAGAISALDTAKEDALGNPTSNGDVLASTTGGVRSWITLGGGGDMVKSTYDPANKAEQVLTIGDSGDFATAAQGALADSATQPGDLATVATSGAYADLSGTPTLPSGAIVGTTDTQTLTNKNIIVPINDQTGTTYTLVAGDAGKLVRCNNAAAVTLTILTNASVAFDVGTVITISQVGAGQVTVGGAGVTLNAYQGAKTQGQYAAVQIIKTATDTWTLFGGKA